MIYNLYVVNNKYMWELGFLLSEKGGTRMEKEKTRMNPMVPDWTLRYYNIKKKTCNVKLQLQMQTNSNK